MKSIEEYINEKFGKIIEAEKIYNEIVNDIFNNTLKSRYKFNYKNKEITVIINLIVKDNFYKISAHYNQDETDYKNNIITISIIYNKNSINTINRNQCFQLIVHEIMHGAEDLFFHYNMSIELKNANNTIENLYADKKVSVIELNIAKYNYLLNSQEMHAYLSQLYDSIKEIIEKHNFTLHNFNYKKFKTKLYEIDIWKSYFGFYDFIEIFKTNNIYLYEFNKTHNHNYTLNQAISLLTKKFNKFKNKFEELVPKITFEILYERSKQNI